MTRWVLFVSALLVMTSAAALVLPSADAAAPCTPASGLMDYWPADGSSGADLGPGNHPASAQNGAGFTPAGQYGGAFDFPANSFFDVFAEVQLPSTHQLSGNAWVRDAASGGSRGQLGKVIIGADNGGGEQNKWVFHVSENQLMVHLNGAMGPIWFPLGSFTPAPGTWHMVTFTYTLGSGFTGFIDGVQSGTSAWTGDFPTPTAYATIGQAEGIGYMNGGAIDELSLWNTALDASQVAALYHGGPAVECGGPPAPLPELNSGLLVGASVVALAGVVAFRSRR